MDLKLVISDSDGEQREFPLRSATVLLGRSDRCDVRLNDPSVSRVHGRIAQRNSDYVLTDLRSANGTYCNGSQLEEHVLQAGDRLRLGNVRIEVQAQEDDSHQGSTTSSRDRAGTLTTRIMILDSDADDSQGESTRDKDLSAAVLRRIVGKSRHIRELRGLIVSASHSDLPVLVRGETGTGKELVARCIAELTRNRRPVLIAVSLPSLDPNLASSELFGHVKGAFTGANEARQGWFELADGATILLDEIGETSHEVQAKLLRSLEEKAIVPVGGRKPRPIDVRVIAATNRPLLEMTHTGGFSEALYYRLSGLEITLDPLRQRRNDIPLLVWHFIRLLADEKGAQPVEVSREAMEALSSYSWPGNVRELRHCVEQALLMAGNRRIEPQHLPAKVREKSDEDGGNPGAPTMIETRRQRLVEALRRSGGNQSQAAKELGMTRQAVNQLIKSMQVRPEEWQS